MAVQTAVPDTGSAPTGRRAAFSWHQLQHFGCGYLHAQALAIQLIDIDTLHVARRFESGALNLLLKCATVLMVAPHHSVGSNTWAFILQLIPHALGVDIEATPADVAIRKGPDVHADAAAAGDICALTVMTGRLIFEQRIDVVRILPADEFIDRVGLLLFDTLLVLCSHQG